MRNTASPSRGNATNEPKPYDEERLEWGSVPKTISWPKKYLRLLRPKKQSVYLFLIDITIISLLVLLFEPLITLLFRNEELFGARLTLPVDQTPSNSVPEENKIPRIFHQTSATKEIPEDWNALVKTCTDAYADWEYKHWTDETAREFISTEYSWFLDIWDNFDFPIQRADAIRYFILYHFGGLYLDMDTICNRTIPLDQIEADGQPHHAVFKSTTPTGVSNDFMVSSKHHPLLAAAIKRLPYFVGITKSWSWILPHAAIMISSGPFFLTMVSKTYLLELPSTDTTQLQVINATELLPYITDLEASSWHHGDTKTLMWLGDRPWVWLILIIIGTIIGCQVINWGLMKLWRSLCKLSSGSDEGKVAKLT